jgi:acyl-coenzyme A thioesterase PaaI-like protein
MNDLESSIALKRLGPELAEAHADPKFEGNGAMFGGWIAALLTQAALSLTAPGNSVISVTIQYLKRVTPGTALRVKTQCLRMGRQLEHWRCELVDDEVGSVATTAHVILGQRVTTECYQASVMPSSSNPGAFPSTEFPFPCFKCIDIRIESGEKWFSGGSTRSLIWTKFVAPGPLDAPRLAFLGDISPPRSYYVMAKPRPTPTVMMTLNIFATQAELTTNDGQFVLCEMVGTRMEECASGAVGRIWSRQGKLLATTEQLQWTPPSQ